MGIDNPERDDEIAETVKSLEQRLAAWRPSAGALHRDRMLYDAGRAAARADGSILVWRLATAALLFLSVALSGLLARQTSLLVRERSLLARERAEQRRMGTSATLIASTRPEEPSGLSDGSTGVMPFAPASYFVLTSRLVAGELDASWRQTDGVSAPVHADRRQSEETPAPAPLRTRDVNRVLDL